MKAPCVANLDTARELLEYGVLQEGASALSGLRRCAQTPGCEDWRNCSSTVESAWRNASESALPEVRPRPAESTPD